MDIIVQPITTKENIIVETSKVSTDISVIIESSIQTKPIVIATNVGIPGLKGDVGDKGEPGDKGIKGDSYDYFGVKNFNFRLTYNEDESVHSKICENGTILTYHYTNEILTSVTSTNIGKAMTLLYDSNGNFEGINYL